MLQMDWKGLLNRSHLCIGPRLIILAQRRGSKNRLMKVMGAIASQTFFQLFLLQHFAPKLGSFLDGIFARTYTGTHALVHPHALAHPHTQMDSHTTHPCTNTIRTQTHSHKHTRREFSSLVARECNFLTKTFFLLIRTRLNWNKSEKKLHNT